MVVHDKSETGCIFHEIINLSYKIFHNKNMSETRFFTSHEHEKVSRPMQVYSSPISLNLVIVVDFFQCKKVQKKI